MCFNYLWSVSDCGHYSLKSPLNYTSLTILWHGQGIKEQGKETHGVENFIDQNTAS